MKIDHDLRVAIRAAANSQPPRDHEKETAFEKAEIQRIVTLTPERSREHRNHQKQIARARKILFAAGGFYGGLGICFDCDKPYVQHDEKFRRAGGKQPPKHSTWRAEKVLGDLARATPAEGSRILKNLGIRWS